MMKQHRMTVTVHTRGRLRLRGKIGATVSDAERQV
jgi:hypothetical protein